MRKFIFGDSKHRRIDDNIIGKYNNEFNGTYNSMTHRDSPLYRKNEVKYNFYTSPNNKDYFGVKNNEYSDIPYWYNFNKLSRGLPEHFSSNIGSTSGNYFILCIIVILILTVIIYKFI